MATLPPAPCPNVGFLSAYQEGSGFLGGYLVTNPWGRPLEFRLSSAVQPNKVQQILYGDSLAAYVCGDVIGKTLIEKATTPVQWLVVDNPVMLELRRSIALPVGLWYPVVDDRPMPGLIVQTRFYCHAEFPDDVAVLRAHTEKLGALDFGEPFTRIREAMKEARKMGVLARSAA